MGARNGLLAVIMLSCGGVDGSGLYDSATGRGTAQEGAPPGQPASPGDASRGASAEVEEPPLHLRASEGRSDDERASGLPQVLWTQPEDGQLGVFADAEVLIQFSRSMDEQSVARALRTNAPGEPVLSWEGDGSLLRVGFDAPLPYARGLDAEPEAIVVELGEGGRGADGAPLEAQQLRFFTFREVVLRLAADREVGHTGSALVADLTAALSEPSAEGPAEPMAIPTPPPGESEAEAGREAPRGEPPGDPRGLLALLGCAEPGALCAGDGPFLAGSAARVAAFLSFDLSAIGQGAHLQDARLRFEIAETVGEPLGRAGLGALHVERSFFDAIDEKAVRASPDATVAVFSEPSGVAVSGDIRWVIQEAMPQGRAKFRVIFPQSTDRDLESDLALLDPGEQVLSITYLTE